MSATGRSDVRVVADVYPTPSWCVRRLLEAVELPGGDWLEPAVGEGAIVRAVNEVRDDVRWSGVEIRDVPAIGDPDGLYCGDFLKFDPYRRWSVCITNPPYSLAREFIEHAWPMADHVAMLLRLNFLGGEKRATAMRKHPPDVYVLPNRPSFTGHGTDATEYCWMVWRTRERRQHGIVRVLASTPRTERCP